jgi:hypothetical protein
MSRTRKRLLKATLTICLLLATGWSLSKLHAVSPLLTHRATRIMTLSPRIVDYHWLSDEKLMAFPHPYYRPQMPTQLDLRTGQSMAFRRFGFIESGGFSISPDRRRAVFVVAERVVMSAALDGSSHLQSDLKGNDFWTSNPTWLPDSRSWVQLITSRGTIYAVVTGLDPHDTIRKIPLGKPKGTSSGWDWMPALLLGSTQTGRILATPARFDRYTNPSPYRKINFFEFSTGASKANLRQFIIRLPKGGTEFDGDIVLSPGEEVALSPRGDRLAWIIHVMEEPPRMQKWLSRWLPSLKAAPREIIELRISQLDGSDMKIIGYIDAPNQTQDDWKKWPDKLRWLPDGQRLSFLYDNALWTIPAR